MWAAVGFVRLIRQHLRLRRAAEEILEAVGDVKKARVILFRLTDEEIDRFAKGENFEKYAQKQDELRWRLIRLIGDVWQKK